MAGKYKRKARKASTDVVAVLRRARALVKRGWCQGAFAETADGDVCDQYSRSAASWCALGAIFVAGGAYAREAREAFRGAISRRECTSITAWNDSADRTKPQVLRAFTKAIAKAEAAR